MKTHKIFLSMMTALTVGMGTLTAEAEPLAVGAPAPDAAAVDQQGNTIQLADVFAKGPTLIYFYPKADTSGCTKQACSIRDDWSKLSDKGIQVYGVSGDTKESQLKFQEKYNLPFPLLADTDSKVAGAFGVPTKNGIPQRMSFLIRDGKVVWTMLKASTNTHAADVLAAFEALPK